MGSRNAKNEKALNWAKKNGSKATVGTFSEAASFGERIFICVQGIHSIEAITSADPKNFKDKILIDLSNPYIYENGHISLDPNIVAILVLVKKFKNSFLILKLSKLLII